MSDRGSGYGSKVPCGFIGVRGLLGIIGIVLRGCTIMHESFKRRWWRQYPIVKDAMVDSIVVTHYVDTKVE